MLMLLYIELYVNVKAALHQCLSVSPVVCAAALLAMRLSACHSQSLLQTPCMYLSALFHSSRNWNQGHERDQWSRSALTVCPRTSQIFTRICRHHENQWYATVAYGDDDVEGVCWAELNPGMLSSLPVHPALSTTSPRRPYCRAAVAEPIACGCHVVC
ncbi:hypothetical protein SRHO_G00167580 [Serrasalmus rhombeus]